MSAADMNLYGRIVHNGKAIDLPRGKLVNHMQQFVVMARRLESRGLSSLALELKATPFERGPAPLSDEDQLMTQLLAAAEHDDLRDSADLARFNDPLFVQYMSMTNRANVARETPETLAMLRAHIESNHPDYYRKHGHHF